MQHAQRDQHRDQQQGAETDGEGFEARQRDGGPQQRQDDEGERERQIGQRQVAEGQEPISVSSSGVQRRQGAAVIGEAKRRQRQHPIASEMNQMPNDCQNV